jgi:hypothetical protein
MSNRFIKGTHLHQFQSLRQVILALMAVNTYKTSLVADSSKTDTHKVGLQTADWTGNFWICETVNYWITAQIYGFFDPQWKEKTPWPESKSELYRPRDSRLSAKLVPTFADRGCHVVRVTDPYGRILGFLDPFPDPVLLRIPGGAGNRTRDL